MMTGQKVTIHKFGGSCLRDKESFAKTLSIMKKFMDTPSIAVLSAFRGITDKLIGVMELALEDETKALNKCKDLQAFHEDIAKKTIQDDALVQDAISFSRDSFKLVATTVHEIFTGGLPRNVRDYVVSFGERLSSYLFSCFLKAEGLNAQFFPGDALITTSSDFGSALPLMGETSGKVLSTVKPALDQGTIPIVAGFYGEDINREITTLGRGGTDFTATILANVLSGVLDPVVMFWKDVDGLLTANPNIEKNAMLITQVSYDEAKELAYFGSKVLHPLCLSMTMEKNIPVEIRNFNKDLDAPFTQISGYMKENVDVVKAIACIEKCVMVTVQGAALVSLPGIAAKIFDLLAKHGVNILFISQASSENNITFVVNEQGGPVAVKRLQESEFFGKTGDTHWIDVFQEDVSLIAVVGHGMARKHGISGQVFTALGNAGVNVRAIAQGSSELNISILISPDDLEAAIHAIHEKFSLHQPK